jgi:hypothetical protein
MDIEGCYSFSRPAFRPFVPASKAFGFPMDCLGYFSYWFSVGLDGVDGNIFSPLVYASAPLSSDVIFGSSFRTSSFVRQL